MSVNIIKKINSLFTESILLHGPMHNGVLWNSQETQYLRFEQLLKILPTKSNFSLTDLGCGYGELYNYLRKNRYTDFDYMGIDISEEMVNHASSLYNGEQNCHFYAESKCLEMRDYTIASGIFNLKQEIDKKSWELFIFQTLDSMNEFSKRGFSCNFLTSYSDQQFMRDDLYYADPLFFFDYCKRNISKNIALLHDYEAYDFTLLVRK